MEEKLLNYEIITWNNGNGFEKIFKSCHIFYYLDEAFSCYNNMKEKYDHVSFDVVFEKRIVLAENNK